MAQALELVSEMIAHGARTQYVCFCEANLLSKAVSDSRVADVLNQADATFADGIALVKLAQIYGHHLPGRVSGPSFFLQACEYGVPRGWRHYFYGGADGVAETLASLMRERFPGIQIVGTYAPPFRSITNLAETDCVLQQIDEAGTDLLWVGLGGPKQEIWMAEHQHRVKVPVMLGVGAAFDFHSGQRSWAPSFVRTMGLEWVWRMFTGGPTMFKRNVTCVTIVAGVLLQAFFARVFVRKM